MLLNEIATQLNLQPALVDHARLQTMLPALVGACVHPKTQVPEKLSAQQYAYASGISMDARKYRPYTMVGNIAVIPVQGVLLHKYGWSSSYATGYDVLQRKLKFARQDRDVKGIYQDFQTYGGTVAGCPDTADLIAEIAQEKPIAGHAHDAALSAGLWMYSQCDHRFITQSAQVGSLGTVLMHVNQKKLLDQYGLEITLLHEGSHKVDGNPFEALGKDVKARLQAGLAETRLKFARAVARGTGISEQAALDTKALCFEGQKAIDVGFAQQIVRGDKGIETFQQRIKLTRNISMTQQAQQPAAVGADAPQAQQPAATQPPAAQQPAADAAPDSQTAAATERQRISAILTCDEAKGRGDQANHLAFNTSLSAEDCKGILAAAPIVAPQEPQAQTPADRDRQFLASVMEQDGTEEANAGADDNPEQPTAQSKAESILAMSLAYLGHDQK